MKKNKEEHNEEEEGKRWKNSQCRQAVHKPYPWSFWLILRTNLTWRVPNYFATERELRLTTSGHTFLFSDLGDIIYFTQRLYVYFLPRGIIRDKHISFPIGLNVYILFTQKPRPSNFSWKYLCYSHGTYNFYFTLHLHIYLFYLCWLFPITSPWETQDTMN